MKIYIGADHAGYELKEKIKSFLGDLGHESEDKGASSYNADDDYPDFVKSVAEAVANNTENKGIIIGGTGQGEAICANRIHGVRAALFYGPVLAKQPVDISGRMGEDAYEIVHLARLHNNANVLALSARFLSDEEAFEAVRAFLETPFSGEERHKRRINKY